MNFELLASLISMIVKMLPSSNTPTPDIRQYVRCQMACDLASLSCRASGRENLGFLERLVYSGDTNKCFADCDTCHFRCAVEILDADSAIVH